MINPPKRTGLTALARLHRHDVSHLIDLVGLFVRWYAYWSGQTAELTTELLAARRRKRHLNAYLGATKMLAGQKPNDERVCVELEEVEEREAILDADQREAERAREVYEKAIAASLRVLDVRRAELSRMPGGAS